MKKLSIDTTKHKPVGTMTCGYVQDDKSIVWVEEPCYDFDPYLDAARKRRQRASARRRALRKSNPRRKAA